jgi:hypothetical protein
MNLLAHKQVLSKKRIFMFAFSIIALFAFSASVMAGCCFLNGYEISVQEPTAQACDDISGSYFFEEDCGSPTLSYYVDKQCCLINLSNKNYCYYSSIANAYKIAAGEYSVGTDKVSCFNGTFGSDGTNGCIQDTQGGCPSPEPVPNCAPQGCIQAGSSPLFCTAQGSIVSDCAYCLDNNCGGLSCNAETGVCENTEPRGCSALGGTYSCCAECDPAYSSNSSFDYSSANADSCSNNQKCCEKCASQIYCCKYSAQCNAYDVANNPNCQGTETGCTVACEQWKCNLQAAINSNSNYPVPSVCWCGGIERNTATDTGYCCASDPNGQYSESPCGTALAFSISGTVFDADTKQPITNAVIIVNDEGMASSKTSSDGRYALAFSVDKKYTLTAYAPNYYFATKTADVSSIPLEIDFSLQNRVSSNCTPEKPSAITGFNATHDSQGRIDIRLFWDQKCQNLISAYYIKRNDSVQKVIPSSLGHYIDNENLRWNTSYKYEIWAVYKTGGSSPRAAIVFRTGNALCEGVYAYDEFCGKIVSGKIQKNAENSNLRLTCTALNSVITSVYINGSQNGYYRQNCSEYSTARFCALSRQSSSDRVLSRCILSNSCEGSGNPFGLFYTENSCSAITDASCFFDFSRTTVDSCNSCRADLRCSEFASQNACAENTCGLNCTWQYTNSELEKGICYSEGQSGTGYCDECNSIFMGCDDSACGKLGRCMLTDGLCSSCPANMICANYTSQEACSGHSSQEKFELCIEGQRIFKSNNDACKMLKCFWTGTQCVKDGNYDSTDDCSGFSDPDAISDCVNDNSAPITSISGFGYSPLEGAYFNFSMSKPVVKISYCLDRTDTCCPDAEQPIDNKNTFGIRIREGISDSGMYYLRFSSVDKFGNQEGIKSVPVIVSGSKLSATIKSYFTDASRYNLTVIVQVDDGMTATCTFDISGDAKSKVARSNFGRENSSFEVYFAGLDYANYLFFLNCTKDGAEYTIYQPMIKESSSKFKITVVSPYARLGLPAVGRGSYNVIMNFSEPVTITYLNYELLDGSFSNGISQTEKSTDMKNWNFTMEIPEDPGILSEITKNAKISVSARTDSDKSLNESEAYSPYFIIDTRAPEIVIRIE